ncbi:MAG: GNAT family N-acetyltransferase [Betaproteobacteria bacterium]
MELDNPVWSCLATRHAHLAEGREFARRYPPDVSPLAGVLSPAPAHVAALEALFDVGDEFATAGKFVPKLSSDWQSLLEAHLVQMVRSDSAPAPEGDVEVTPLKAEDIGEMLALVELTRPGPFRVRTVELGTFIGIRDEGRLVAMTGERMWIGDYREISAVCTHPDVQGRGYARALIGRTLNRIIRAGQIPFLHAESSNVRAIALYQALGFVVRAEYPLLFARRTKAP